MGDWYLGIVTGRTIKYELKNIKNNPCGIGGRQSSLPHFQKEGFLVSMGREWIDIWLGHIISKWGLYSWGEDGLSTSSIAWGKRCPIARLQITLHLCCRLTWALILPESCFTLAPKSSHLNMVVLSTQAGLGISMKPWALHWLSLASHPLYKRNSSSVKESS